VCARRYNQSLRDALQSGVYWRCDEPRAYVASGEFDAKSFLNHYKSAGVWRSVRALRVTSLRRVGERRRYRACVGVAVIGFV
jgi:hypothetical protein